MKSLKHREEKSTIFAHRSKKNIMMLWYIDKEKSGKKKIICFITRHGQVEVTNFQRLKPQVIIMYDHTKGEGDVVNLISCYHSTQMKLKHWPLTAFAFMLDTIRAHRKKILEDNKMIFNNFEFTYQLRKASVLPKIQQKPENSNDVQMAVP